MNPKSIPHPSMLGPAECSQRDEQARKCDKLGEATWSKFQQGDIAAFGLVYSELERPVAKVIRRHLKRPSDADDAIGITWMKVQSSRASFEPAMWRSGPAWIKRIAYNVAIDRLRSRDIDTSSEEEVVQATTQSPAPSVEELLLYAEFIEIVRAAIVRAIHSLQDKHSDISEFVRNYYYLDLDHTCCAKKMNASARRTKYLNKLLKEKVAKDPEICALA